MLFMLRLVFPDLEIEMKLEIPFDELLTEIGKDLFGFGLEISHESGTDFYMASFGATEPPTGDVPEPSILALIGAGLLGFGYIHRPRQKVSTLS